VKSVKYLTFFICSNTKYMESELARRYIHHGSILFLCKEVQVVEKGLLDGRGDGEQCSHPIHQAHKHAKEAYPSRVPPSAGSVSLSTPARSHNHQPSPPRRHTGKATRSAFPRQGDQTEGLQSLQPAVYWWRDISQTSFVAPALTILNTS